MADMNDIPDLPFDFERLLPEALAQALSDENPDTFLAWLRRHLPRFAEESVRREVPPQLFDAMAAQLRLMIWNALPLPGNNFTPRPLPLPGRNDPCPCGSGLKFKQCCSSLPRFPALDPQLLWPLVLEALNPEQRRQAFARQVVPVEAVAEAAQDLLEEDRAEEAVALLRPLFAANLKRPRKQMDIALQVLCDALDDLDRRNEKLALLERIIAEAPSSPLRAGAWQRLAAMRIDQEDYPGARQALDQARRDDPEDPALGLLEIQLLGTEARWEEARDRARFWAKRLSRPIYDPEAVERLLDFFREVIEDPQGSFERLHAVDGEDLDAASRRLIAWVRAAVQRPLSDYRAVEEAETEVEEGKDALAARLRGMGLGGEDLDRAMKMFEEQMAEMAEEEEDESAPEPEEDASLILEAPGRLRPLEKEWHEVFSLAKPFGTQDQPMGDWEAWEPQAAERWCAFLERHPEGADSLDIIDDLATAVFIHPDGPSAPLLFEVVLPLLQRAGGIVEKTLDGLDSPRLFWNRVDNRPALRSLVRLWTINHMNLEDDHGLRYVAMNDYLRRGQNEAALQLAEKFPNERLPETRYGLVLALYRLGRVQSAQSAAEQAVVDLPHVARHLVRARVRKPKLSPFGFTPGGEDQAWLYREEMREVWLETPGALDWLKKIMQLKGVK